MYHVQLYEFGISSDTVRYIEDITRWREDMNFMFEWQEQYLTSKRSERVRYCFCHERLNKCDAKNQFSTHPIQHSKT